MLEVYFVESQAGRRCRRTDQESLKCEVFGNRNRQISYKP
jgi:hypothetical protein